MADGYYRFPTIHGENVVFVCEDDLWTVPAAGGVARRLTANLSDATWPRLSPDGEWLAFTGREEGSADVYVMPAIGGPARRMTFLDNDLCQPVAWTADGRLVFGHSNGQPFDVLVHLYALDLTGGEPAPVNVGPARAISYGADGGVVIGRNNRNPARWKRYRGGSAGQVWIDETGDGAFRPLIDLDGNLDSPIWLGERIYFLSDHEGVGNLYSCLPSGSDVQRHTDHQEYYARNASSDGRRIIYHAGADLYLFDPEGQDSRKLEIALHSPQTQRNRKFVYAAAYLHDWALAPQGKAVAVSARGKPFSFPLWEGAVLEHEHERDGRYRLLQWLNDGKRLIAVTDVSGEESFVILEADGNGLQEPELIEGLDTGRPLAIAVNPKKDQILFSNHRYELMWLDLESRELVRVDRGKSEPIHGFDWSPDGAWAAYSVSVSLRVAMLKLWNAASREQFPLTQPVLQDIQPAFDPQGNFIFFLSYREFDPVYDNLQFDLNFPLGVRPYLITLRRDQQTPFREEPEAPDGKKGDEEEDDGDDGEDEAAAEKNDKKPKEEEPLVIDVEGITERIIPFPVEEGRYGRILGTKDGDAVYSRFLAEGALNEDSASAVPAARGTLYLFDFEEQKEKELADDVTDFDLAQNKGTLIYRAGNRLRVLKAGAKAPEGKGSRRESGWLDLSRVKVSVDPAAEWRQMYREAWRLQRDQFWTPDMSQIDWLAVYERYLPLVERVASRGEFSDLIWEMQGELGTSHAYELGGDYRPAPRYDQGYLGTAYTYDEASGAWAITSIVRGDAWDEQSDSPLNKPGINVAVGQRLLAINGKRLSRDFTPQQALVNLADEEVALTLLDGEEGSKTRTVVVKALCDETAAYYRQWVEQNRRHVHEQTEGRVGYVHVPDMGPRGYAEFHRGFLSEIDRESLIVDVRFNGGGHVSQLILQKLARRRVGYDVARWSEIPVPYPGESVLGPIVALTNEWAGSDGDIFSHVFKLMGLGPLIGKRTWGGVIGINPRHSLVDNSVTTQPEFSFWFEDVGWKVENYGTDPDIEVDNAPQDYAQNNDAQLERAVAEALRLLEEQAPTVPTFDQRPDLSLPKLPPRNGA